MRHTAEQCNCTSLLIGSLDFLVAKSETAANPSGHFCRPYDTFRIIDLFFSKARCSPIRVLLSVLQANVKMSSTIC